MGVEIMKAHKYFFITTVFFLVLTLSLTSVSLWASDKKVEQKKSDIRKMAKETLSRLYKIQARLGIRES